MSDDTKAKKETSGNKKETVLLKRVTELQEKLAQHLDGWQRARADYQNLKRDWEQRRLQFLTDAKAEFLRDLLPVYDHLKQSLSHVPLENRSSAWVAGI